MAGSLFNQFNRNQNGAMSQQFANFVNSLDANVRNSPQQMVQQLINSGRMSQAQFEQFRRLANQYTGKNY